MSIRSIVVRLTVRKPTFGGNRRSHGIHAFDLRQRGRRQEDVPGGRSKDLSGVYDLHPGPSPNLAKTRAETRSSRPPTATTVRVRNGKTVVTDGPFAETKEQLGGYYLVEAKDLDEAISIAARIPGAKFRLNRSAPHNEDEYVAWRTEFGAMRERSMEYMLLIYVNEAEGTKRSDAEQAQMHREYMTFTQDLVRAGKNKGGNALEQIASASTVRVRDGKTMVIDGPFAETKEQLGGYYLVEAKRSGRGNLDRRANPRRQARSIEVRHVGGLEKFS